ncbi:hypothetical protein FACS189491_11040 [Spirochaetia bacterium]|nr:hypothetical protein FACS189491_11040 [Spirochaetia bacterium]
MSRAAVAGLLNTANPQTLEYRFEPSLPVPPACSLELEYGFSDEKGGGWNEIKENYQLALHIAGGDSWILPWDVSFLMPFAAGEAEKGGAPRRFHYAVPLSGNFIESFSIEMIPIVPGVRGKAPQFNWKLRELRLVTQWYGLVRTESSVFHATPFVYDVPDSEHLGIDPPSRFRFAGGADISIIRSGEGPGAGGFAAELGGLRFEAGSGGKELLISQGNWEAEPYPVKVEFPGIDEAPAFTIRLIPAEIREFPNPVPSDPGIILEYPQKNWRWADYEVFRWEGFPSLLIFDTADYAVQSRLFKRLSFFVEKAGFTGRLASDAEIAEKHGWNAHDYRSEDLARFFETARAINFPLLKEERDLEQILLDSGIIRRGGEGIVSGEGGIISISWQSPDYLRSLFMVHEGFHGLFFIDPEFREFSRRRWEQFDPAVKRFTLSFFDYQGYNIKDEYLVVNEFMAHILQQPASQASRYFNEKAAVIDASPWRRTVLPPKDEASGSWPLIAEAFRLEAAAFSAYVNGRWGLAAGRVRQITAKHL